MHEVSLRCSEILQNGLDKKEKSQHNVQLAFNDISCSSSADGDVVVGVWCVCKLQKQQVNGTFVNLLTRSEMNLQSYRASVYLGF